MDQFINLKYLVGAIVYSFLGLAVYAVGFLVIDRTIPGHLWKEIFEEHNTALAIILAGISIGIAIIIASAIHG